MASNRKAVAVVVGAGGLAALALLTGKAQAKPDVKPKAKPRAMTPKERAVSLAVKFGRAFGVPPSLVIALMAVGGWRERGYVANTRGGAWGYTFMTLATAADLTKRFPAIAMKYWPKFKANPTGQVLYDPAENIALGAYQMSLQWKRFKDWYTAALSYYTGAGAMDKLVKQGGGKLPATLPANVARQKAAYVRVRTSDPYVKRALTTSGVGSDPLIWTPSLIRQEMSRIRVVLDAVNIDVSKAAKPPKPIIDHNEWLNWEDFYKSTHAFLIKDHGGWGGAVSQARNLEQTALTWRELIKSRGGKTSGPEQGRKAEGERDWGPLIKGGIIVAGIGAAAALVSSVKH
jgi:Transglycosylase SLT domain